VENDSRAPVDSLCQFQRRDSYSPKVLQANYRRHDKIALIQMSQMSNDKSD